MDNKLSVHFCKNKTKSMHFASQFKIKKVSKLNIACKNIQIKPKSKVTYFGRILHETISRVTMALKVINTINSRLKFSHRKIKFLTPALRNKNQIKI